MEHETPTGECEHCFAQIAATNIEAFELIGALVCDDCAEAAFEQISEDIE